jgi:hypothetical protein
LEKCIQEIRDQLAVYITSDDVDQQEIDGCQAAAGNYRGDLGVGGKPVEVGVGFVVRVKTGWA